jgi:hypothetical protein
LGLGADGLGAEGLRLRFRSCFWTLLMVAKMIFIGTYVFVLQAMKRIKAQRATICQI